MLSGESGDERGPSEKQRRAAGWRATERAAENEAKERMLKEERKSAVVMVVRGRPSLTSNVDLDLSFRHASRG